MSFILRQTSKYYGVSHNTAIGSRYLYVNKHTNPEEFNRFMENMKDVHEPEKAYGFVSYDTPTGLAEIILFPNQAYYIMTESGVTFEKLRYYGGADEESEKVNEQVITDTENQPNQFGYKEEEKSIIPDNVTNREEWVEYILTIHGISKSEVVEIPNWNTNNFPDNGFGKHRS